MQFSSTSNYVGCGNVFQKYFHKYHPSSSFIEQGNHKRFRCIKKHNNAYKLQGSTSNHHPVKSSTSSYHTVKKTGSCDITPSSQR
ncbi:hypothetical protein V3C99_005197 [Haemonchus contortus]